MKLTEAREKNQLRQIERLYASAFPPAEQKPFPLMLEKRGEGAVEILSIEDGGGFAGLAIMVRHGDLALLDYFAISPERRGGGIGGNAFELLKRRYAGKRFFIEIENAQKPAANAGERIRRKAFYLRHGMTPLPFFVDLFGVEMELLSFGCPLSFDEYLELYRAVFGRAAADKIRLLAPVS